MQFLFKDDPFLIIIINIIIISHHSHLQKNSPSKIIVIGFGLNPSPPGQRVLYSAKVKYNKRQHVSLIKNKIMTTES